jgi:hypothetical protein
LRSSFGLVFGSARAGGEEAFNVARVIGHARSTIVDTNYGHTVDSALAG